MIINTDLIDKGKLFPQSIIRHEVDHFRFYFYTKNDVILNISVMRDSLLRFRYTSKGFFNEDFSYAVDLEQPHGYNELDFTEHSDYYEIRTSKVVCRVIKADCRTAIYDLDGKVIMEDELGFHWQENHEYGGNIVIMTKMTQPDECFYGMGDKATSFNLKGKRIQNWVTDQFAYGKDQDPLYKAIPFYTGLHRHTAYGVFFDNTFRSYFDFSSERNNVTSFWADGGEMNYYFIYGPEMKKVVSTYTQLTGKPEMPPMWSLGYHQSKWSYPTEERVTEITDTFRAHQVPCDCIHLDIDYMDNFRCFTWNNNNFPEPKAMVDRLSNQGFKVVAIIDPGIKIDPSYEIFKQGLEQDYFCKRADGPMMRGKVWPGECAFPDFTNPEVREWWAGLFKELIQEIGIQGVWNDMNEPAIMEVPSKTFPSDVRHDFDGHPCSHRKAHNVYGMQMAKATYEGLKTFSYPKRPFVITRSAYAGTQRYTSTWTGDNIASWEHLWIANIQMQRLSVSGFSFCGSDVGGFAERPSGELYARWIQLAVFHPLFRTHSSGDHGNQEPWSFGDEILKVVKRFIELRYQLLPYLYTAFWEYITDGDCILKPLVLFDQEDSQTHYRTDEFIFGNQILVCPVLSEHAVGRRVYLPKGNWYNYWTNEKLEGRKEFRIDCGLEQLPLFILEGAIIPRYPVQQYVGELTLEEIYLDVYYKHGKESSTMYEDNQDGYDYVKGRYTLRSFSLIGNGKDVVITQHKQGDYQSDCKRFVIQLIGMPFEIDYIEIDREPTKMDEFMNDNKTIILDENFSQIRLFSK